MKAYRFNGQVITKSGAYLGVPLDLYHSGALCAGISISSTGLRRVLESPAHFYATHPILNPDYIEDDDSETKAMIFGSACHCHAFEPELFGDQFLILPPDAPRRPSARQRNAKKQSQSTIDAIEFWDGVATSGKCVLTSVEFEEVQAMAAALRDDEMARGLFSGGAPEVTYAAKVSRSDETGLWSQCADDDEQGVWLLARPDYTPLAATRSLLDYKTTACAKPEKWSKHAFALGYDIQADLARWVFGMATGETRPGVAHVVQETKAPHVTQSGVWINDDLDEARLEIYRALDRLYQGLTFGKWPAYDGPAFNIIKPNYLKKRIDA